MELHEMEGVLCVDFHCLILSMVRIYLEKINGCSLKEEKAKTMLELHGRTIISSGKEIADSNTCNLTLLIAGLKIWQKNSLEESEEV